MIKLLPLFFVFLFFSCKSKGDQETLAPITELEAKDLKVTEKIKKKDYAQFLKHYDRFFQTNFNVSECPGAAVVIVKDSSVIYQRGFGVKKVGTKDSVDIETVFRIASLSKGVTATLVGNMVDRGELHWNQNINELLPTFKFKNQKQSNRLEIRHVLSHTTGLYQYTFSNLIQQGASLEQIISNFKHSGVIAREDAEYRYQNAMFAILEKVITKKTNQSFSELLQQRLFKPAGMDLASSSYVEIKNSDNIALPHQWNHYSKKYYLTKLHNKYYNVAAAGGINASIKDMGQYLKILLGNRPDIISKASLEDIFNPYICTSNSNKMYVNLWDGVTDSYYAFGWRVLEYRGRKIVYHGGNVNQYKSQLLIDIENQIAICVLFSGPNPFNGAVMPTFLSYYDFYTDMSKLH